MASRLRTRKQKTSIVTPEYSTPPASSMFQSRPFVVQSQTAEKSQQPDLKTSLMRAKRYGHSLHRIQHAGVCAPKAVQPKLRMGHQVESDQAKAPQMIQAKLLVGVPGDMYNREADAEVDRIHGEGEQSEARQRSRSPGQQPVQATMSSSTTGGGGTPLERVRKTFNVPALPRLFVQSSQEKNLADLLCSHHTDLNRLINNDATKMQELIIYIKDDIPNKLANLINLNNMLPAGKQVIKLDRRNDHGNDPNSTDLISVWASCPLKADVTTYISNNGFEELRKLIKLVPVAELGAAVHIVGMWHASQPQRLQASKMPGWAHVYKNYPPKKGISSSIRFNPSMLEDHVAKHLCNRGGNPDSDEPWRWMQRLGHSVTLSDLQTLATKGHATLNDAEKNTIFGSGNSIKNQASARYFFTTYLDNNPKVVPHFQNQWKETYANDATKSMRSGRAFVHSDDSGASGTPIHISADANPVFVIAKFVTNEVLISAAYMPTNLTGVVDQNEANKVWDL